MARDIRARARRGEDPHGEKIAARQRAEQEEQVIRAGTVAQLAEKWFASRKAKAWRPATRTTAVSFMVHTTKTAGGKKHRVRGATEQHPSLEKAKAPVEGRLAATAIKKGWTRKERRQGFEAKPDGFGPDSVPVAGTETKASKKK